MSVKGWCELHLLLGGIVCRTRAFVFEQLAEQMLLGATSLREHESVVDARIVAIYPGENNKLPLNPIKMFQVSHFNEKAGVCLYQSHTGNALYAVKPDGDELLATTPCERGDAEVYGLMPSVAFARGKGIRKVQGRTGI
eukprot:6150903-Pleurochrysis_carterae.AAC.1